jgi:hypothetical protein
MRTLLNSQGDGSWAPAPTASGPALHRKIFVRRPPRRGPCPSPIGRNSFAQLLKSMFVLAASNITSRKSAMVKAARIGESWAKQAVLIMVPNLCILVGAVLVGKHSVRCLTEDRLSF